MLKFDWNFLFTIVNLIVFYLLMKKFLFGRIKKVMDERRALMAQQEKEAEDKNAAADAKLAEYEAKLAEAKEEGAGIIAKAQANANAEYDRVVARAREDAAQMKADAQQQIDVQRENAVKESRQEIAELAMQAAEKVLGANVSADTDSAIFDEFLNAGSEE